MTGPNINPTRIKIIAMQQSNSINEKALSVRTRFLNLTQSFDRRL